MIKQLVEHIEGEAVLTFHNQWGKIRDVQIDFPNFRGIELILKRKPALDALVISPRVCGICGHSHLMAAVRSLESILENSSITVDLTLKAKVIRDITLYCEIIQNHLKWFYLTLSPKLASLTKTEPPSYLKMHYAVTQITSVIAIFAGQWPHSSYAIPGGVVCDPTPLELMHADALLCSVIEFFEEKIIKDSLDNILSMKRCEQLLRLTGDLPDMLRLLEKEELGTIGKSHGRFIVLGEHSIFSKAKMATNIYHSLDIDKIEEEESLYYGEKTFAKKVKFNGKFYETGPLARALTKKVALIRDMFRRNKDTITTRITARVYEIAILLHECRRLISTINIDEPSYINPKISWQSISGKGIGVIEAPRGSLIHKISIENGTIKSSQIITPTQWNLSTSSVQNPGIAQKAMIGLKDTEVAEFVFRTFDVCSVCTTH
ncbi:nickel-dependent hydrogenase large subunit [Hydrogenimonas thermophila]|uniref:Ni,Fe-hydrogenase I large subunit n=1 Tax=Hydrogenimonas thermophila TaxID=223786 RepID=A0A1I5LN60_9BACT|nr:nickel-dependent hydrogenase large subunit [Hydrogenimonas thermophila]WOE69908.1 nickel-dependent hydrogenase large subunit [Hydrogenimonas thermophila]WOE72423.1 nickel-dependent hydrogenase large subunit [Hydrogenimonas thermophila]SFO98784.1 Ni,Fe-hydrogenase I large subunit [Hydrogenimonas thermophila]